MKRRRLQKLRPLLRRNRRHRRTPPPAPQCIRPPPRWRVESSSAEVAETPALFPIELNTCTPPSRTAAASRDGATAGPGPSRNTKADAPSGKPLARTPKTLQSVGESLVSSVSCLGRQSFEGHGMCPVDKALCHGDSALGVCQLSGVFSHVYAFKHLRLASHGDFGVGELDH